MVERDSIEILLEYLNERGITDKKKARKVLNDLIEEGFIEGNDEIGYILTERGVYESEEKFYGAIGVV